MAKNGAARIWNCRSGQELQRFSHGTDDLWNAIPLPGGTKVATTGKK